MELTLEQALQKGIEAHRSGQVEEADRYYTAIIKANPKHADANHNMGVLAVGVGKVTEALPFFKTALEVNPSTAQYWLSYIDALVKLDRMADAKAVFDQAKSKGAKGDGFDQLKERLKAFVPTSENGALEKEQEQPNILDNLKLDQAVKLAQKKAKDGSTDEAKRIYEDILIKFPKNKKVTEGIKALSVASISKISATQDPPQDQLKSLMSLYKGEQLSEVLSGASKLLIEFPNSVILYNLIGVANKGLRRLEEAMEAFTNAISIKPDIAEAHYNLGVVLNEIGQPKKAIISFTKAISIRPDFTDAYNNMGNALKDQGKLNQAIQAYKNALAIKPKFTEAYFQLGNALQEQGKLDEAIEAYIKALSIKPEYAEAYNNMGVTLNMQGKRDEAIEAYTKALSIKPEYADAYSNMGNACQDLGKLDEAIDAYTKALSIKPDYAGAWNNLYFPLQAIKFQKQSDQNLGTHHPKDINSNYSKIQLNILDYKLNRGQESAGVYLASAMKSLSDAENISIKNPTFDKNTQEKILTLPDKMVALVHFGRSGTGLMHSLIDGHPEVSTLPSIYFSEYFDHSNWVTLISDGWDGMIDRFVAAYEVLFDASSSVPVESRNGQLLHSIGKKEGMANVGDQRNEVLIVNKDLFRSELKCLMARYVELDAFVFFQLVQMAYDRAINDYNSKSLIFYHIHNPDTYAQLNFVRLNPNANFLFMVREPIQSCESWARSQFVENDHFGVANKILIMLFEIDNSVYSKQNVLVVRLEDLKTKPRKTIPTLCKWMGIEQNDSLYEMTAQGKKWWGDPSSPDFEKDGQDPFGKTSINRKVGSIFSENDQFILRTLFYPFSARFGYTEENEEQFKVNLQKIRPMIDEMFGFEKKIAEQMHMSCEKLIGSGSYLYLRSGLIERWNTLNKYQTYPNMINPLKIETDSIA